MTKKEPDPPKDEPSFVDKTTTISCGGLSLVSLALVSAAQSLRAVVADETINKGIASIVKCSLDHIEKATLSLAVDVSNSVGLKNISDMSTRDILLLNCGTLFFGEAMNKESIEIAKGMSDAIIASVPAGAFSSPQEASDSIASAIQKALSGKPKKEPPKPSNN